MKRFTITGVKLVDAYFTYVVEAEDEDTAIEMIESGEVEPESNPNFRDVGYEEEFYVQSEEEI